MGLYRKIMFGISCGLTLAMLRYSFALGRLYEDTRLREKNPKIEVARKLFDDTCDLAEKIDGYVEYVKECTIGEKEVSGVDSYDAELEEKRNEIDELKKKLEKKYEQMTIDEKVKEKQ